MLINDCATCFFHYSNEIVTQLAGYSIRFLSNPVTKRQNEQIFHLSIFD